MEKKVKLGTILMLVLIGMLTLAFNIEPFEAEYEFYDDFDGGLVQWNNFGSPTPSTFQDPGFHDGWGYSTEGDGWHRSGSWSKQLLDISNGIVVEFRVKQEAGNVWDRCDIGVGGLQSGYREDYYPYYFGVIIMGRNPEDVAEYTDDIYYFTGTGQYVEDAANDHAFHIFKIVYDGLTNGVEFYKDGSFVVSLNAGPRSYDELPLLIAGRDYHDTNYLDWISAGFPPEVPNQLPTAHIDSISPSPATEGQTVSFSGHGNDPDGSIVAYEWRSSIHGFLSSSSSFSTWTLSVGTHTIYFKVKDDDDAWSTEATATLTITEREEEEGCIIATATYGSELAPEVQFLRGFRNNIVLSTFAGGQFMRVFNAWYYSFSPGLADFIASNAAAKTVMKGVLYPLIGILHLSSVAYSAFAFSPELGVVVAGLVASSLIGVVYFTLPATMILAIIKRFKKKALKIGRLKLLAIPWLISVVLMLLGEISVSPVTMMAATASFVLIALVSSATVVASKITQRLP